MSTQTTSTYGRILSELFDALFVHGRSENRDVITNAIEAAIQESEGPLSISNYATEFRAPIGWLADVENRISGSIHPFPNYYVPSPNWLAEDAALAALRFFRNNCDLLPGEPHIYGTRDGELVAEFETELLRMTGVVSAEKTTLFGYRRDKDEKPQQIEFRTGSNQSRDDIRSFSEALGIDPHGETVDA